MAAFVTDTFTDANDTQITAHTGELGATWTLAPGDTSGGSQSTIKGNKLGGPGSGSCICYASGAPGGADYTVSATFVFASGTWPTIYGPAGRMSTSAETGYFAILFSNEIRLYKYVAGSLTQVGTGDALTPAAGTFTVTLAMSGTTIAVRVQRASDSNWLASGDTWQVGQADCISETDASIAAAGKAGFWANGDVTVGVMDSFSADAAAAASFNATPVTIPKNHPGNITITLAGTDTTWAGGGSEFAISGVAGVTKVSENVTSATAATLVVTTGSTGGTLTITDLDTLTDTVAVDGSATGLRSVHLDASTTAFAVQLTQAGKHVIVHNRHASAICYFTIGANLAGSGAPPTAVAAADDTYPCGPGKQVRVPSTGGTTAVISIISSAAATPVSIRTVDIQPDHRGRYD
jgi:hypothetical protein